jgi:hypothetical protein
MTADVSSGNIVGPNDVHPADLEALMSARDYSRLAACHRRFAAIGTCRERLAHYHWCDHFNPVGGKLGGLCCSRTCLARVQRGSGLKSFRFGPERLLKRPFAA